MSNNREEEAKASVKQLLQNYGRCCVSLSVTCNNNNNNDNNNNNNNKTDRTIPSNKPDIIIRDNEKGTCMLIDVAISGDRNVIKKEADKILKYEDLTIEIQRMWNIKTRVIPVVIGGTGTVSK
jgi:hypothetical protein